MAFDLDQTQRNIVAEKVLELSNLSVVALVVSQILSSRFELFAASLGMALFLIGYIVAFTLMKGGEQ